MSPRSLPAGVDSVIVGNGPSALILSYILHGNIPYYDLLNPHPDQILHKKLLKLSCLLDVDVSSVTGHFRASRLSYSTQALPVNVLLDTLIRPLADTEPGVFNTCVKWRYNPLKAVPHIVLGNTVHAGGQWADNPVVASWDIGALSYAEMLSLPGYTLIQHYAKIGKKQPAEFHRPTRREIADYLAYYPEAVGISDSIWTGMTAEGIRRTSTGFYINSLGINCQHLVLASGIFSRLLPARPQLLPLLQLPDHSTTSEPPLLVVGSGFTAADVIISALPNRKIIHIFKWSPDDHPSPLRACHADAYPDYAGVYRRMKFSAAKTYDYNNVLSPPAKKQKANPFFDTRDWDNVYEGLPNTYIQSIQVHGEYATVALQGSDGKLIHREISNLQYVIGRRGSLQYLDHGLLHEVLDLGLEEDRSAAMISGQSLRAKVENNLEVAPGVFIIGSLTGDSLIRYAFGGCVFAAREIAARRLQNEKEPYTTASRISDKPNGHKYTLKLSNKHGETASGTKPLRSPSIDLGMITQIYGKHQDGSRVTGVFSNDI